MTKPAKEFTDSAGRRKIKGNMDIELAIDALELAPRIDHMVLFSGDGDFRSLVEAMQRRGVRVTVVSTIQTQPAMIADDLRRQADEFVDLVHLIPRVGRDPGERGVRTQGEGLARNPRDVPREAPRDMTRDVAERPVARANPGLETRYGIRQGDDVSEQ